MLLNNRIIWEDDTTLKDISKNMNDIFANTTTFPFVVTDDYLYLGSDLPFNHRYFDITTVNAVAATVSVSIWDGTSWVAAVDVIDDTSNSSGVSLSQSGIIRWVTDRNQGWGIESTTEDVPALSTLKIYDLYWVRLSWSASLTAGTVLNYIGHKFATDTQLEGYYPDLVRSTMIDAFKTGKTNWKEQHILAAEELIADLKRKRDIISAQQILNPEQFNLAGIHKVAEIIFRSFGEDYKDQKLQASIDYKSALNAVPLEIDRSEDGHKERSEQVFVTGLVRR